MTSFQFVYGFAFEQDSTQFLEFIGSATDHKTRYSDYLDFVKRERESNVHHGNYRTVSFKDFCQSEYFDPYEELVKISHIEFKNGDKNDEKSDGDIKWTTTFVRVRPDANKDSATYYIHGVSINFKTVDVETELNFGKIEDLVNKIPKIIQDYVFEQQHFWNWPNSPRVYCKSYAYC